MVRSHLQLLDYDEPDRAELYLSSTKIAMQLFKWKFSVITKPIARFCFLASVSSSHLFINKGLSLTPPTYFFSNSRMCVSFAVGNIVFILVTAASVSAGVLNEVSCSVDCPL